MDAAHDLLAPSSAGQWVHCPGSVRAQAKYAGRYNQRTEEGTAAHWVAATSLETVLAGGSLPRREQLVGTKAPNGVVVDDEIFDGAMMFCSYVLAIADRHHARGGLLIEQRLTMPRIHARNSGTIDAALMVARSDGGLVLHLFEYKHGHRYVPAYENWQLTNYAEGLRQMFQIDGAQDQRTTVVMHVVQPFCYQSPNEAEEWAVTMSDLRPYWNQLEYAAGQAMSDDPPFKSGTHCRDCAAVATCPAARKAAYSLIEYVERSYATDVIDNESLVLENDIISKGSVIVNARAEAIEEELLHRIKQGQNVPGLSAETTPGRLKWSVPPQQATALASQFGADATPTGVKTPKQTLDTCSPDTRLAFEQVLKSVTERPAGKLKLVKSTDTLSARAFRR